MITFKTDDDRKNFQVNMALTMLRTEVKTGLMVCDPRKGSTIKTLARFFQGLKNTIFLIPIPFL